MFLKTGVLKKSRREKQTNGTAIAKRYALQANVTNNAPVFFKKFSFFRKIVSNLKY